MRAIGDLASHAQKRSRNCDKQLHRLVCYINSTVNSTLVGTVQDSFEDLRLALYVMQTSQARRMLSQHLVVSWCWLGPHTHTDFPLAWVSKRQTSVSRSTTTPEIVSLAYSLYPKRHYPQSACGS